MATGWRDRLTQRAMPRDDGVSMSRWRIFASVFLIYLAYAVVDLWTRPIWQRPVGLALMGAFVVLYLAVVPRVMTAPSPRRSLATLGVMFGIVAVYLAVCGGGGIAFGSYLAVSVVVLLPLTISVPVVLAMAAGTLVGPEYLPAWNAHGLEWSAAAPILLTGVVVVVMRATWRTHAELHDAREQISRLAADRERLRIARDLHDLLGHSLTTVIVKAELAARLAPRDAGRAAAEMTEVAALARQGLTDVRAAVAGYREVSLAHELATAREVLHAAGIYAELPSAVDTVPAELRELFGWAVREGVTNAVRHSRARTLRVELSERSIEVLDDGAGTAVDAGPGTRPGVGGSGLAGLAERAAALGGKVLAGPADTPTGYRLRVEVPA
jgi:two-component system, NarL family, sensor histidine kinase DesK